MHCEILRAFGNIEAELGPILGHCTIGRIILHCINLYERLHACVGSRIEHLKLFGIGNGEAASVEADGLCLARQYRRNEPVVVVGVCAVAHEQTIAAVRRAVDEVIVGDTGNNGIVELECHRHCAEGVVAVAEECVGLATVTVVERPATEVADCKRFVAAVFEVLKAF